jgi:hypothetical protein
VINVPPYEAGVRLGAEACGLKIGTPIPIGSGWGHPTTPMMVWGKELSARNVPLPSGLRLRKTRFPPNGPISAPNCNVLTNSGRAPPNVT